MNEFNYQNRELYCEQVPLARIAEQVGTPAYVYSKKTLTNHFRAFDGSFNGIDHLTCYSVKANSNLAVLALLGDLGAGADIVSGGELYRAGQSGIAADKIIFSGVGKSDREIRQALEAGILMFNVESEEEFRRIDALAGELGVKAPIALRVNPDIDPNVHPYITTGLVKAKFGISHTRVIEKYRLAAELKNLKIVGVACHIGSQILEVQPFADALERLVEIVGRLREDGFKIEYLDLGGGVGITYNAERPPHLSEYARVVIEGTKGQDLKLILEPGRAIVGNAGILLSRVLYRKQREQKNFIVVDAGMNDLIRPALYGSYHAIQPVLKKKRESIVGDVVGPICESGDFLAQDRPLPLYEQDALIAVMSAGAYGFTMSSNYNSRTRPPEILVDGDRFEVVRRRESYQDLVSGETIPKWLKGDD